MKNICHRCKYHEICMNYRYSNVATKYMTEITREENKDGNLIIFVQKCSKFNKKEFKNRLKRKKCKKIQKNIQNY